jgi:YbbR domain-containing protein
MRLLLRRNLYLKIFSLVLALTLWMVVSSEDEGVKDLAVPLEYVNLPLALDLSGRTVDTVAVRLRAAEPILHTLTEDRLTARIDLSRAILGEQYLQLTADMLRLPGGVEVVRIDPDRIPVRIEKRVRREVPVVAEFAGQPARGYEVTHHVIDPASVTIEGPASEVAHVRRVMTGTIVLADETSDLDLEVTPIPDAEPGSRVRVVAPRGPVRVHVSIESTGRGAAGGRGAASAPGRFS